MNKPTRQTLRWWACCVALFVGVCLSLAADKKPRLPVVPKVTILKNDKKPLTGEFIEATPAGVTIKPLPKGEPTLVPWSEIKTVSNGLTRQKIVDDWKTTKSELLCDTCHGDGTTKCEVCKGTGVEPTAAVPCDKCKGSGDLGKCPKCKEGKVPCPASCLKPSMFTSLPVNEDGKKHKTFRNKDGSTHWWSEGHVGELVVQEDGQWTNKGKCPTCNGTSEVICPTCHGTAKRECPTCHGAGVTGKACATCKIGRINCPTCNGTGLKSSATPAATPAEPAVNP